MKARTIQIIANTLRVVISEELMERSSPVIDASCGYYIVAIRKVKDNDLWTAEEFYKQNPKDSICLDNSNREIFDFLDVEFGLGGIEVGDILYLSK